jgi:hypothetical protein
VGAPAPLQEAGAALSLPAEYYAIWLRIPVRRHYIYARLTGRVPVSRSRGAYYVMTDICVQVQGRRASAKYLVQEIGVGAYRDRVSIAIRGWAKQVRFAFCKKPRH